MNMVRLWGGGYYESDKFYQLCDELGLMVLARFHVCQQLVSRLSGLEAKCRAGADYQVRRLRNHPSIALWSGNNEVESVSLRFPGRDLRRRKAPDMEELPYDIQWHSSEGDRA